MWAHAVGLITGNVVLVHQGVPALDPLVLVLQTLVPVLQPLPFGRDAQLAPTCQEGGEAGEDVFLSFPLNCDTDQRLTYVIVGLADIIIPHWDV